MGGHLRGEQVVKTYVYLFKSADSLLKQARTQEEGQFYQLLSSLIMQAFAVEAYLNHLIAESDKLELASAKKCRSVWEKFEKISNIFGRQGSTIHKCYPLVAVLYKFRNAIAHAQTETVKVDEFREEAPEGVDINAYSDWQKFVTIEKASACLEQVRALIENLHSAAGLGKYPLMSFGTGVFSFRETQSSELS